MNGWIFFSIHLFKRNLSTLCWDPLGFVLFLVESDDLRGGLEVTLEFSRQICSLLVWYKKFATWKMGW